MGELVLDDDVMADPGRSRPSAAAVAAAAVIQVPVALPAVRRRDGWWVERREPPAAAAAAAVSCGDVGNELPSPNAPRIGGARTPSSAFGRSATDEARCARFADM